MKEKERTLEKKSQGPNNVLKWTGFSVIIALVPILGTAFVFSLIQQSFSWEHLIAHELPLISIALMGEAFEYLLTNLNVSNSFKGCVGFVCLVNLIGSALLLGVLTIDKLPINTILSLKATLVNFGIALLIGCICKWNGK